jgi:hypothetical protein
MAMTDQQRERIREATTPSRREQGLPDKIEDQQDAQKDSGARARAPKWTGC